jgi:hypothetical protein
MTKRTRLFLTGSAGILVVGLGTGVVASYMGIQTIIGGDGPADLAYVPQDARVLAYANVREVMDSELRAKLESVKPDVDFNPSNPDSVGPGSGGVPDGQAKFFDATGVDVERDVDSLVASFAGVGESDQHPLVVARGRFNNGLIESAIMQHADGQRGRVETYQGTRMVVVPEDSQSLAVAFAEPGLLVIGSEASVRRALDAKTSGKNVIDNAEVMKLVRESDDGNAWAVARFDALTGRGQIPQEIASRLPAIGWFAASGHINGGLRAVLRAETRDDASAQSLREVIRGFMALARLQTGQRAEFADMLNTLELGGTGKTVSLGFSVDSAMIDAIGGALRAGPRPPVVPEPPTPPVLQGLL